MQEENVELVRRVYDAWNGGDPAADVLPYLDEDFEWVNPDYAVEPGIRRGHEGWRQVCANLDAVFGWYEHVPGECLQRGDKVLCFATFRSRGRDSSVPFDKAEPHVWTIRDGRILRIQWFHDEADAREAAGMPRPPARPLVVVVDESSAIGRAVERDLQRALGDEGFDTRSTDSAAAALELLSSLRECGGQVALLVADHDLSTTSGIQLAGEARELFEGLKTIAFVRYADMGPAIEAMNAGSLDYYFIKPLGPSGEQLSAVASDLLADWKRRQVHAVTSVRVVADRRSEEVQPLAEFLARNDIQYRIVNPESAEGRELTGDGNAGVLPLVVLGDGKRLEGPSTLALARALGMVTSAAEERYDLVIVGAGPAGLAGAVYGASEGLRTVLIERLAPGGQAGQSSKIENYLGFPGGLTGSDLAQRAIRQCRRFDAEIVRPREAVGLEADGLSRAVELADGTTLSAPAVLIACGVSYRRLEVPGVEELVGRGVYYGAGASDARDYAGQDVAIVGGANSAGQAALHFAQHARHVTLLVRGGSLDTGMSHYLVERISSAPNIEVELETTVVGAGGEGQLERVAVESARSGGRELRIAAMFIFIGAVPHTDWLMPVLARDERGFILTGRDVAGAPDAEGWPLDRDPYPLEAAVPGVFVAGDVRHGSIKRVASAVGEGAMAVQLIHQYLAELPRPVSPGLVRGA